MIDKFLAASRDLHTDIPADQRVLQSIEAVGLSAEYAKAVQYAPKFSELACEALGRVVPATSARVQSERAKWEKTRAERRAAQGDLQLIDPHGVTTAELKTKLSFSDYWYHGKLVSVDALLADSLARAEINAELAREEAEARLKHKHARDDLFIWQELKNRAEAAECMAAE